MANIHTLYCLILILGPKGVVHMSKRGTPEHSQFLQIRDVASDDLNGETHIDEVVWGAVVYILAVCRCQGPVLDLQFGSHKARPDLVPECPPESLRNSIPSVGVRCRSLLKNALSSAVSLELPEDILLRIVSSEHQTLDGEAQSFHLRTIQYEAVKRFIPGSHEV